MKIDTIDVQATIETTRKLMAEDQHVSPGLKASIELLLLLVTLLLNRLGINSSKPPSLDPNREKKKKTSSTNKKPGGQKGHTGTTLEKVSDPDIIKEIKLSATDLPEGDYKEAGYDIRQVIDIDISRVVTEYRAQVLENANGKKFTAAFPEGVNRPVQYGVNLKAHSVYMSQYQLIPYNRIEEHFQDQAGLKISSGSLYNFNKEAYEQLEIFDKIVKRNLINAFLCHVDETGININGKRLWLHCVSNDDWTYFSPTTKEGELPWMKWESFLILKECFATITGNHISDMTVYILCVTLTT